MAGWTGWLGKVSDLFMMRLRGGNVPVLADPAEEELLDCGHCDVCGEVMGPVVCFVLRFSCA